MAHPGCSENVPEEGRSSITMSFIWSSSYPHVCKLSGQCMLHHSVMFDGPSLSYGQ